MASCKSSYVFKPCDPPDGVSINISGVIFSENSFTSNKRGRVIIGTSSVADFKILSERYSEVQINFGEENGMLGWYIFSETNYLHLDDVYVVKKKRCLLKEKSVITIGNRAEGNILSIRNQNCAPIPQEKLISPQPSSSINVQPHGTKRSSPVVANNIASCSVARKKSRHLSEAKAQHCSPHLNSASKFLDLNAIIQPTSAFYNSVDEPGTISRNSYENSKKKSTITTLHYIKNPLRSHTLREIKITTIGSAANDTLFVKGIEEGHARIAFKKDNKGEGWHIISEKSNFLINGNCAVMGQWYSLKNDSIVRFTESNDFDLKVSEIENYCSAPKFQICKQRTSTNTDVLKIDISVNDASLPTNKSKMKPRIVTKSAIRIPPENFSSKFSMKRQKMCLKRRTNNVWLIAINDQGPCKVKIDTISSLMIVESKNGAFETKLIPFNRSFVFQKSAIFVYAENASLNFCLIFAANELCEKVYSIITSKQNGSQKDSIVDGFIIPIFNKIAENPSMYYGLIEILDDYVRKLDNETQEQYRQLMKERNIDVVVIPHNMFQLSGEKKKRLITFQSEKKDLCYTYAYVREEAAFQCSGCHAMKNVMKLKLKETANGEKYLISCGYEHVCESKLFKEYKCLRKKIIPRSMFEVHCSTANAEKKKLKVYTSEKKERYYIYQETSNSRFRCSVCRNMKCTGVFIHLKTNEDGEDYLVSNGHGHVCTPIRIKPAWQIIPSSMFEFHANAQGVENRLLIVFTSETKDEWYALNRRGKNVFQCQICARKKTHLYVTLKTNDAGEQYLESNGKEHACSPYGKNKIHRIYKPGSVLIPASMFQLHKSSIIEKLILFTSAKKDGWYTFSSSRNMVFRCDGCKKNEHYVSVKLLTNKADEQYLKPDGREHVCIPVRKISE